MGWHRRHRAGTNLIVPEYLKSAQKEIFLARFATVICNQRSDSNIRLPFEPRLRMLESKDHQQIIDAGGALDLTFA
jgi:hypothetical protein